MNNKELKSAIGCAKKMNCGIKVLLSYKEAEAVLQMRQGPGFTPLETEAMANRGNIAVAVRLLQQTLPNMICDSLKAEISEFIAGYVAYQTKQNKEKMSAALRRGRELEEKARPAFGGLVELSRLTPAERKEYRDIVRVYGTRRTPRTK